MNQLNGLKINEREIEKMINDIIKNEVKQYKKIGAQTHKELRQQATIQWFTDMMFPLSKYHMIKSLRYKMVEKIKGNIIELEFVSQIDATKYNIVDTSMYRQRYKYPIDHFSYIIEDLQWKQGILGLPRYSSMSDWHNLHFHQGDSLASVTEHVFNYNWRRRLNQHCRSVFGVSRF